MPIEPVRDSVRDPVRPPQPTPTEGPTGRAVIAGRAVWFRGGDPIWVGSVKDLGALLLSVGLVDEARLSQAWALSGRTSLDELFTVAPHLSERQVATEIRNRTWAAMHQADLFGQEPTETRRTDQLPARWLEPLNEPHGSAQVELVLPTVAGPVLPPLDADELTVVACCQGRTSVAALRLATGWPWTRLFDTLDRMAHVGRATVHRRSWHVAGATPVGVLLPRGGAGADAPGRRSQIGRAAGTDPGSTGPAASPSAPMGLSPIDRRLAKMDQRRRKLQDGWDDDEPDMLRTTIAILRTATATADLPPEP